MLGNLKSIHRAAGDVVCGLAVQERLVRLLPEAWEEWRDRGLLLAELGQSQAAADDLALYLREAPEADDAQEIRRQLRGCASSRRRVGTEVVRASAPTMRHSAGPDGPALPGFHAAPSPGACPRVFTATPRPACPDACHVPDLLSCNRFLRPVRHMGVACRAKESA
jgi:hypothetical protein